MISFMAGQYVVFGPKLVENWSSSYLRGFCMGSCHSVALPTSYIALGFVGYNTPVFRTLKDPVTSFVMFLSFR